MQGVAPSFILVVYRHLHKLIDIISDLNYLNEVRNQIPITKQKRDDMYSVTEKKP